MKYLREYMEDAQTEVFKKTGAFFAFSNEQFEKGITPGVKTYVRMGAGMFCPKENAEELMGALDRIYRDSIQQDIAENGIPAIIRRELGNYECMLTGDVSRVVDALEDYGVTEDRIRAGYAEFFKECVEKDWF